MSPVTEISSNCDAGGNVLLKEEQQGRIEHIGEARVKKRTGKHISEDDLKARATP